jgi:hypothetical protein
MSSAWGFTFGPAWGNSWGVYAVDAAESAAVDSGDISRAFAVDYSPLHLTPYEIAARRRFLQKIIGDIAAAKKKRREDEEIALLALYSMLPKAA